MTCGHRVYGMSCNDLDALYVRAGHACEICGAPERPGDPLNIDHEAFLGKYAVRGLLCRSCNGWLGNSYHPNIRASGPEAERYLDAPWWARSGGPRALGHARWAPDLNGGRLHTAIGTISKIGKWGPQSSCGVQLASRSGYQLWEVIDSRICARCAERDEVEIRRLEFYRSSPHAFVLPDKQARA